MCGFVGSLALHAGVATDIGLLRSALDAIAHRGPDAEGMWEEGPIALGHRRLSILDMSDAGTQPMHSSCGQFTIAFNGEIYNFLELRAELETLGSQFQTDTDTEVILEAWRVWGADCLARFNGMWAFALWDHRANELVLSRDRFGIKPLYLGQAQGRWVFGSELQALVRFDDKRPTINRRLALDYLEDCLLDHTNDAAMAGWERVRPSEWLVLRPGSSHVKRHTFYRYEEAGDPARRERISRDSSGRALIHLQEDLREALRSAIRLRMRADVPSATSLSGGIDSGSIACFVAEERNAQRSTMVPYGFYARTRVYDEMPYVQAVAERAGLEIDVTELDLVHVGATIERMLDRHDEPLHSMGPLAGYLVFEAARRRGVTVLLNGQGADEQAAGYGSTVSSFLAAVLTTQGPKKMLAQWRAEGGRRGDLIRALRFVAGAPAAALAREARRRGIVGRTGFASAALHDEIGDARWLRRHSAPTALRAQLDESFLRHPLPLFLRVEDRNSMAHGCEARLPFLDPAVVSLLATTPSQHMRRDGYNKSIIREAVRGVLPETVRTRRDKMGFNVPQANWLRGPLREWLSGVTSPAALRRRGLYDVDAIIEARRRFLDGEGGLPAPLYRVALFEAWATRFIDR